MKLNTPLGGQTTILGKLILEMGEVVVVVAIGLLAQSTKASETKNPAATQEAITTRDQKTLAGMPRLLAMWENPPMEDSSKNFQIMSILKNNNKAFVRTRKLRQLKNRQVKGGI